jgi:hypothetical protein
MFPLPEVNAANLNLWGTDFGVLRRLWPYSAYNNKAKNEQEAKN